jgi:hypothetical protein
VNDAIEVYIEGAIANISYPYGATGLLKMCQNYKSVETMLLACPVNEYSKQWLNYIQSESEQLECSTVFEWVKAANRGAAATTTTGNASTVGEEEENELDRALAGALKQWAAQLKTDADAADKGTGKKEGRNDFDEAELARQRAVMDQIFKEVYGTENQTGKNEPHFHALEELSESGEDEE